MTIPVVQNRSIIIFHSFQLALEHAPLKGDYLTGDLELNVLLT